MMVAAKDESSSEGSVDAEDDDGGMVENNLNL